VQHYWSLPIEEQFYIIWPLIVVLVAAMAARSLLDLRRSLLLALGTITVLSFTASVWLSYQMREYAYFVTHTRPWELGLGSLLAFVPSGTIVARTSRVVSVAGLSAIALAFICFSSNTILPGYTALLPTLGP
jgi:peptidoglycan/LPS O-acetylase OafA/YrhL